MSLLAILFNTGDIPLGGWWILLGVPQVIPPIVLVPRFILNLRALYAHDLQGRDGRDIDSAFGLSSGFIHDATASAIVFADSGENEGTEQGEEIQLMEMTGGNHDAGTRSV